MNATYECQICHADVLVTDQPTHMDGHTAAGSQRSEFGAMASNIASQVTGAEDGLDRADAVTAALIMAYVVQRPALGHMDKVGLTALAELSIHDPQLARSLAAELA